MLAVDAGTTGVRCLAVDREGGVVDVAYRELTTRFPRPAWVEQDPGEIRDHVRATLGEVADRVREAGWHPATIGLTNQRETAVAWDRRSGQPLHPAIVWQDRRTADFCSALREAGHEAMVRERTGLVLDPYFSATKYHWLLHQAGLREHDPTSLVLGTVDSWVLWWLTGGPDGGILATDPTNASRTLLFDTERMAWSDELAELFDVPLASLAEVRPSCGRLGHLHPGFTGERASGLSGLPISGMAGDQQAALFGQACFTPGAAKITYGTGSFLLAACGGTRPQAPEGLVSTVAWDLGSHAGPGERVAYALEGSTFVSGAAIQWLRDELGLIERADELGPLAESVPDSGGLTFVPAFTGLGSPWWDPAARGTVTGITRGAGRAQLARAVVEALAFQVRDMADAMMAATGRPLSEVRADGGAAAMGLLLQLQADQLRVPVSRPPSLESTALGAATLAGLAEGLWNSLDDLASGWQAEVTKVPEADPVLADALYGTWQRAVERSRGWAGP